MTPRETIAATVAPILADGFSPERLEALVSALAANSGEVDKNVVAADVQACWAMDEIGIEALQLQFSENDLLMVDDDGFVQWVDVS